MEHKTLDGTANKLGLILVFFSAVSINVYFNFCDKGGDHTKLFHLITQKSVD